MKVVHGGFMVSSETLILFSCSSNFSTQLSVISSLHGSSWLPLLQTSFVHSKQQREETREDKRATLPVKSVPSKEPPPQSSQHFCSYLNSQNIDVWPRTVASEARECGLLYSQSGEGNGTPLQYSCLENPRDRGARTEDTTERLHFHFSLSCIGEGNGNPLHCSCLENSRDWGAWWAAVYGVTHSRT